MITHRFLTVMRKEAWREKYEYYIDEQIDRLLPPHYAKCIQLLDAAADADGKAQITNVGARKPHHQFSNTMQYIVLDRDWALAQGDVDITVTFEQE